MPDRAVVECATIADPDGGTSWHIRKNPGWMGGPAGWEIHDRPYFLGDGSTSIMEVIPWQEGDVAKDVLMAWLVNAGVL